jgi:glycosyltransferase involved in cell wall biosynthesis
MKKILIFDSHPVQYRSPIWRIINSFQECKLYVCYATDLTLKGYRDKDFNHSFSWDEPLLEGYNSSVLNAINGQPFNGFNSLTKENVAHAIRDFKPDVIFLTGLNYQFDWAALIIAKLKGIPVWLRCETQDEAFHRSFIKSLLRKTFYTFAYLGISKFFYIGKLNKKHYLNHFISEKKLFPALYGTVDRFSNLTEQQKNAFRKNNRQLNFINDTTLVIGFSGKFINKKNPKILFEMIHFLSDSVRKNLVLYFIGSGELENELKETAQKILIEFGIRSIFSGFINQTQLPAHYLTIDILILPSRRMGETWGLVVNEAMQSGSAVIVSDAVGSAEDFKSLERFRVFKDDNPTNLAFCVTQLSNYERSFDWANLQLMEYSLETTARNIISQLNYVN